MVDSAAQTKPRSRSRSRSPSRSVGTTNGVTTTTRSRKQGTEEKTHSPSSSPSSSSSSSRSRSRSRSRSPSRSPTRSPSRSQLTNGTNKAVKSNSSSQAEKPHSTKAKKTTVSDALKRIENTTYEFGGPLGCLFTMVFSHFLLYYVYYCLNENHGNVIIIHKLTLVLF